jgi:threonine dehydrogenase-like Zn-dependent dehydrogenase
MKAAVLTSGGFEIRNVPMPAINDDQVLVKMLACGVCSGDVFVYQNRSKLAEANSRLGHEGSGTIVTIGRNVTDFQLGDIVTALAVPAYAEYFVASPEELVKLPPNINPIFALGEAVACCIHAAGRFGTKPGDKVAVVGCGFMGLVCLQMAKSQGAGFICALDPLSERQAMSRRFGADVTYNPLEISDTAILEAHGEFDIVIEAAGTQSAIDLCTNLVTQHGRIILVGYHQSHNGLRTVNMQQWNFKAIDVVNGHVRRQDEKVAAMGQGMALMDQGQIITKPMVTVYEFAEVEHAFRELTTGKPELFKVVLNINS